MTEFDIFLVIICVACINYWVSAISYFIVGELCKRGYSLFFRRIIIIGTILWNIFSIWCLTFIRL